MVRCSKKSLVPLRNGGKQCGGALVYSLTSWDSSVKTSLIQRMTEVLLLLPNTNLSCVSIPSLMLFSFTSVRQKEVQY